MKHLTKMATALLLCAALLFALVGCAAPAAQPEVETTPVAQDAALPEALPENVEAKPYTYADTVAWDGEYDVVVIGMGFAGMTSAISAADAGAGVLIVDKAPASEAGGNSRVCHQLFATVDDVEGGMEYYSAMRGDYMSTSDEVLRTYVEGLYGLRDYVASLGADKDAMKTWKGSGIVTYDYEHPELPGGEHFYSYTITENVQDGALFRLFKKNIADRQSSIDVWYSSPAVHLVQDPMSKTIVGVQVERGGKTLNIRAKNGVVMACGGFENNAEMRETYLGVAGDAQFFGSSYNTGDGITMAMEVGANLWHMHNYEPGGGAFGSLMPATNAAMTAFANPNYCAMFAVGPDGTRFVNEDAMNNSRHGHVYFAGSYLVPKFPDRVFSIFDDAGVNAIGMGALVESELSLGCLTKADTMEELAAKLDMPYLVDTAANFNRYCENGVDEQLHRQAATLRALGDGPYYAYEYTVSSMLNTQGGPERSANAEIIGVNGEPIPNLYSAGEFGGVTANRYQGGSNVAECLVFGQIAGKNAAQPKSELPVLNLAPVESAPAYVLGHETDLVVDKTYDFAMGESEYMGVSRNGMGGDIVVKVKLDKEAISGVEILVQNETAGVADKAIANIPEAIVTQQTADVDTVSGCTITSKALIEAVKDALSQAN